MPSSCLNGEETHRNEGCQHEATGRIDGCFGIRTSSIDTHDGCTETRNAVETAGDTGASTPVRSREHFGRISVQDAIHDVLEEELERREGELHVRISGEGEAEDKDASDKGCDGDGTLAPNVGDVDGETREDRARHTNNGGDGIVAVN